MRSVGPDLPRRVSLESRPAPSTDRWSPGEVITVHEILEGRIWAARPMTVVRDDTELIALFLPGGARWLCPVPADARLFRPHADWRLDERAWQGHGVLHLVVPGAAHAWLAFWEGPERRFARWYVNFQEPLRRTRLGFETLDLLLDLVVRPDLSRWAWKDEAEFERAVEAGAIASDNAQLVRREAARVVGWLAERRLPFDPGWRDWQPDPSVPEPWPRGGQVRLR